MIESKFSNRFIAEIDNGGGAKKPTFVRIFFYENLPNNPHVEPHTSIVMSIADFEDLNRVVKELMKKKP